MIHVQQAGTPNAITPPGIAGGGGAQPPASSVVDAISLRAPLAPDIPMHSSFIDGAVSGLLGFVGGIIKGVGDSVKGFGSGLVERGIEGQPSEQARHITIALTGGRHITETGSTSGPFDDRSIRKRFDSESSHPKLVTSPDIDGGYRVSTTTTRPDICGEPKTDHATVTTNNGQTVVKMNADGSYTITDNGTAIALAPGESVVLSGGEQVTRNANGSLTVTSENDRGGSISTTLTAQDGGVDVTIDAHNIGIGGDVPAAHGTVGKPGGFSERPGLGYPPGTDDPHTLNVVAPPAIYL